MRLVQKPRTVCHFSFFSDYSLFSIDSTLSSRSSIQPCLTLIVYGEKILHYLTGLWCFADIVDSWEHESSSKARDTRDTVQLTLLHRLNGICIFIGNFDTKVLYCSRDFSVCSTYELPTSSIAMTTSTASKLSKPKSFANELVSWSCRYSESIRMRIE